MSVSWKPRKIVAWREYNPPREWTPILDCGHPQLEWDDGLDDQRKEAVEAGDNMWNCYECGKEQDRIHALEAELQELKSRRR